MNKKKYVKIPKEKLSQAYPYGENVNDMYIPNKSDNFTVDFMRSLKEANINTSQNNPLLDPVFDLVNQEIIRAKQTNDFVEKPKPIVEDFAGKREAFLKQKDKEMHDLLCHTDDLPVIQLFNSPRYDFIQSKREEVNDAFYYLDQIETRNEAWKGERAMYDMYNHTNSTPPLKTDFTNDLQTTKEKLAELRKLEKVERLLEEAYELSDFVDMHDALIRYRQKTQGYIKMLREQIKSKQLDKQDFGRFVNDMIEHKTQKTVDKKIRNDFQDFKLDSMSKEDLLEGYDEIRNRIESKLKQIESKSTPTPTPTPTLEYNREKMESMVTDMYGEGEFYDYDHKLFFISENGTTYFVDKSKLR